MWNLLALWLGPPGLVKTQMKVTKSILISAQPFSYFVIRDQPWQVISERTSAGGGAQDSWGGEQVLYGQFNVNGFGDYVCKANENVMSVDKCS